MQSTVTRRADSYSTTVQIHPQVKQIVSMLDDPHNIHHEPSSPPASGFKLLSKPPLFTPEQVAEIQAESRGSECLAAFGFGVICTFIVGMSGWIIWAWLTK